MLSMNLTGFDLNLLVAFEALNLERSVSKAAQRLGVRQPAMSASLARLRTLFGDELFVRAAGQMRPTAKALEITASVHAALAAAREAIGERANFTPAESAQSFTIASTDYTSFVLLPGVVAALQAAAPNVDLRVVGYDKDEVAELLAGGQVTIALGVFSAAPDRALRKLLCKEHFVGVARRDHPALLDGRISLHDYANLPHALVSVRRDARGAIDAALAAQGLKRRIALTLPHMLALPQALRDTSLVAAIPSRAAARFRAENLQIFDLPLPVPGWNIEMLWNPVTAKDKGSAWLRSEVARVAQRLS
jgi:DNA-binding transcriptional LysR family regulator